MSTQTASIDLTDMTSCGVYFVTPEDIDTLAHAAESDDFNVHRISLSGCHDRGTLARCMAAEMSLPANEAHDWNNLMTFLKDMDGLPSRGHVTLFTDTEAWRQASPDELNAALDDLDETAAIWAREGVAFFVFLPQQGART